MPTTGNKRLGNRLEDLAVPLIQAHPSLGAFAVRERDYDGTISPQTPDGTPPAAPKPVIIIAATDQGRYHRLLPIRNLALAFTVRANSKTPAGNAASFETITGDLENWLDTTNLQTSLSGPLIAVMCVLRVTGSPERTMGLIREQTFSVECRAVAAELTVQGTGS